MPINLARHAKAPDTGALQEPAYAIHSFAALAVVQEAIADFASKKNPAPDHADPTRGDNNPEG
jgi:hypothetical protein